MASSYAPLSATGDGVPTPRASAAARARALPPLALRPRLTPALFYCLPSLLFLLLLSTSPTSSPATPPKTTSPFKGPLFLSLTSFATTWLLCAVKTWWIPNPKDDVLAPHGIRARSKRYGILALMWLVMLVAAYTHLRALGSLSYVWVRCLLPPIAYALSRRYSWRLTAIACMLTLGMFLLVLSLPATMPRQMYQDLPDIFAQHYSVLLLSAAAMVAEVVSWQYMENLELNWELDPWVLASDTAPIASLLAFMAFMIIELRSFAATFAFSALRAQGVFIMRTSFLASLWLLASCFLIHHISPSAMSTLSLLRDIIFCALWYVMLSNAARFGSPPTDGGDGDGDGEAHQPQIIAWSFGLPAMILLGAALFQLHRLSKRGRGATAGDASVAEGNSRLGRFRFRNRGRRLSDMPTADNGSDLFANPDEDIIGAGEELFHADAAAEHLYSSSRSTSKAERLAGGSTSYWHSPERRVVNSQAGSSQDQIEAKPSPAHL
ncbi:hypothetical protein RI367_004812 [Sorochytrium milnesiophthora]